MAAPESTPADDTGASDGTGTPAGTPAGPPAAVSRIPQQIPPSGAMVACRTCGHGEDASLARVTGAWSGRATHLSWDCTDCVRRQLPEIETGLPLAVLTGQDPAAGR